MHNINWNKVTGKHAFASAKERAWHGLGQVVKGAMTAAEAIKEAMLDYHVEKIPTEVFVDGSYKPVPGKFATYRTDTGDVFGGVGQKYTVLQNKDAFGFFDSIIQSGEAVFETAGALGNGERIFLTAKLPSYLRLGAKDISELYVFLTNDHIGEKRALAAITPIRVVCNNTLQLTLRNCQNVVGFTHTANIEDRIKQGAELMGIINQYKIDVADAFNVMAKTKIVDAQLRELIALAVADSTQMEKLVSGERMSQQFSELVSDVYDYTVSAPSQQLDTTKGTMFGFYQGITGYFQNVKAYKNREEKFKRMNLGVDAATMRRAFDLCWQ